MKIFLGADHRGFDLKEKIKSYLKELGYEFEDMGAFKYEIDDDYPDFAQAVGNSVVANNRSRGILICGSGIGIAVAANKINGVRAGTALRPKQAAAAVNDEDLNILALAADFLNEDEAKEIIKIFLEVKFSEEKRYKRRIDKIKKIES
jgi:ribose 5-phosphate isomerase B